MGKIAKRLIKADVSDILRTPAPAYIHHPRSYLEGACYDLSYSGKFLTAAAKEQDPIERLKLVTAMYIAGHHVNPCVIQLRAPLNPIIGETYQKVLDNGAHFYGEQTSHHPPVTNFHLEGPDHLYRFSGHFEYKAWMAGVTTIGGSRIGK